MKHLTDGEIRAYLDQEIPKIELAKVGDHLTSCPYCRERINAFTRRFEQVETRMSALSTGQQEVSFTNPKISRARLEILIAEKEKGTIWQRMFTKKYQPAWILMIVVVVLGVGLTFPQVRAIADSFLGLFRVEQIETVEVDLDLAGMPEDMERYFVAFESILKDQIHIEQNGEPTSVENISEASELANFSARQLTPIDEPYQIRYSPGIRVTIEVDRDLWQTLLDELGYGDVELPESIDGAEVTINIPDSVNILLGSCALSDGEEFIKSRNQSCLVFTQMPSPTISAPPELDINSLGELFLEILGMSPDEARSFSSRVNWSTTLVIPVPQGAEYIDVFVDGVTGTLFKEDLTSYRSIFSLIWIKNGIIHALTGEGDSEGALSLANSLE